MKDALCTIVVVGSAWVTGCGIKNQRLISQLEVDQKSAKVSPTKPFELTSIGFCVWDNLDNKRIFRSQDDNRMRVYPRRGEIK